MSDMVERVARALCEADGCTWDAWKDKKLSHFHGRAETAIRAMREPTLDMVDAVIDTEFYAEIWQQMIDAALSKVDA